MQVPKKFLLIEVKSFDEAKEIINEHYGTVMRTSISTDPIRKKAWPFNTFYYERKRMKNEMICSRCKKECYAVCGMDNEAISNCCSAPITRTSEEGNNEPGTTQK
jgi:hypothetical protein